MTTPSAPLPEILRNTRILIIGAGFIAAEHIKALHALGCTQLGILSRTEASAQKLAQAHNIDAAYGGGEKTLNSLLAQYDAFIVAVPIEMIPVYAEGLSSAGKHKVLLEKPCFLSSSELEDFLEKHQSWGGCVALNRLYYPSVQKLREVVATEGLTSAEFSFTEWVHRIDESQYSQRSLDRWGISNCVHVISTVFDLIGMPSALNARQDGANTISWHPSASIFTGMGVSERGVPFAYQADWNSAGRWWITLRNTKGAYTLCPMEGLLFTPKGSVTAETFMPVWDRETKCGFEPMLRVWLSGQGLALRELLSHLQIIETIFRYS